MTQEQVDVVVEELTDAELDAVGGGGRGYSFDATPMNHEKFD